MGKKVLIGIFIVILLVVVVGGMNNNDDKSSQEYEVANTPTNKSVNLDALDKVEIAFDGEYTREAIKENMDKAMTLYSLPRTEENYSRASSALVSLRKEYGVSEMDILNTMITMHTDGVAMSFPDAAGIATTVIVSNR